jgi:shikimate dehydrogenase
MPLSTPHFQLGLIGYPVSHSLSPRIQNAALRACGLKGSYSLFPIHPDDQQGLKDLLTRVRSGEITGLNVTIPHKQNVIPLLDELTPAAQAIGAVNVISLREGQLIGDNTDAAGFLADLKKFLTTVPLTGIIKTRRHGDLNVIVLGAGGSARSVVYALANDGWNVTIAARRMEQAQGLASWFSNYAIRTVHYSEIPLSTFQLLVNTTPVGMTPDTDHSPLPENLNLPRDIIIYDLVYNPRETKLIKEARALGVQATTGLGMLIEQAALSFEIWTGHEAPREAMRASVGQSLVSSL